jgi:hypothetical protein
LAAVVVAAFVYAPATRGAEEPEQLIVKCDRPCAGVVTAVGRVGGEVTRTYENINALAVSVPKDRVADLAAAVGAGAVRKDVTVSRPAPVEPLEVGVPESAQGLEGQTLTGFLEAAPANYNYNNALTGASTLHAAGTVGQDVIVAVIDSGIHMAAPALGPTGTGSVIGGENFIPLTIDPVASPTSRLNDWHGTGVGGMIAAHVNFAFLTASRFVQSLLVHAPSSVLPCPGPPFAANCPATASRIPMIGTAPAAKLYAMKVFPSFEGGAPESRIIAAMDRAITLRRNFDNGAPSVPVAGAGTENSPFVFDSLNIRVVNMSLGGPTLFAGQDLEDEMTEALLRADIAVIAAAGNDGFAAMTGGSPGTGFGSLTVAAASTAVHERVLRDQAALGRGLLFRPTDHIQTAYFSSRGPTADGRLGPHMTANGFASYVNVFAAISAGGAIVSCGSPLAPPAGGGACASRILFVSGTSFAAPTVAGAAALLRGAAPDASARRTRKALIRGADDTVLGDDSDAIDQGNGFLDVPASLEKLESGFWRHHDDDDDDRDRGRWGWWHDGPDEVGAGGRSVSANVRRAGFRLVNFRNDQYSAALTDLKAGDVAQFFIPSDDRTNRLIVHITDIVAPGPVNQLFGDDLFVMAVDAPTSIALHRLGTGGAFIGGDASFAIDNPQTGLVRLAIQGDWTNGGLISARVTIERERSPLGRRTARGHVEQDDLIPITVRMPNDVAEGVFELFWQQNWGRYPTNDVDMFVFRPDGTEVVDANGFPPGATFNSPERLVVANPQPGDWTVIVNGFTIHSVGGRGHSGRDQFTLRVSADGSPVGGRK